MALLLARPVAGQTGVNVLLVVNDRSPFSQAVADYYAQKRGVPAENIVHVAVADGDEITRAEYRTLIEGPIARAIAAGRLHDRILYIVLTKGLPVRIAGTPGPQGSIASVDSELTLLYRRMTGVTDSGFGARCESVFPRAIGRLPRPGPSRAVITMSSWFRASMASLSLTSRA